MAEAIEEALDFIYRWKSSRITDGIIDKDNNIIKIDFE